ncbi:M48 family metallopeptidase [Alcanivorax sp. 1008]|uniref:M48 family metallopeptidase n=1 Tax=Alcanivorax sp. 1008 TaxID=2816853 RepID=UPI001DC243FA|nr:M48 family metallopeptidase [Alcanivorax sp. 1008]MCC1496458.1 M48 family metalloprotease [Alcanivorax sp. 1008]
MIIRAALLLLTGILLSSCKTIDINQLASASGTLKQAFVPTGEAEESDIGREAAAVLLGAAPLLQDEQVQVYVNKVGMWLALQSDRPDLDWRFAVLDDADINAFAAPGGYVFITKGLLARLRNESELAGVLAHEIGHVVASHHLVAIRKQARLKLAGMAVQLALEERGTDTRQLQALAGGAKLIYSRGLDRKDEHHADRIGVVLAARAGYDPYGLVTVLQTLERMNPQAGELGLLLKTHPKPAERIDQLDRLMARQLDGLRNSALGEDRFRQELAHLSNP